MKKNKKNILIIKCNPKLNSYGEALANEYKKGAKEVGNKIKEISLRELKLERHLKDTHQTKEKLGKDLLEVRKLISWADHLVFAYPIWWGTAPAIVHQFIETVFISGFAFQYPVGKGFPVGLMREKSTRLLVTMDTPVPIYKILLGDPNWKLMKRCTLGFCGIKPIKKSYFGSIKMSTQGTKDAWLYKAYEIGKKEFGRLK